MNDAPDGGAGMTQAQVDTLLRAAAQPAGSVHPDLISQIVAETTRQIEQRAKRPKPFDLNTFEEIENFCDRVTQSTLCPKDYKGRADDAIIAVLMGKEIGLPPMASLQSIAVVNGRPSIWGDAIPGLCMQTGQVQDVQERFDPEVDGGTAFCVVTRKGMTPMEGKFSAQDVTRAGLKNVHVQYPRDMMMWRARHRAWHGAFPDTLKGLGTAELEQEAEQTPQWSLGRPERSWFARPAKKRGDSWDDKWFGEMADKLIAETNAWKLLELLRVAGDTAPSQRDLDELRALGCIEKAYETAPVEAKAAIDEIFIKGKARLEDPTTAIEKATAAKALAESTAAAQAQAKVDPATVAAAQATDAETNVASATSSLQVAKTDTAAKAPAEPAQGTETSVTQSAAQSQGASDAQDDGDGMPEFEAYVFDESGEPDMVLITDPVEFATRVVNRCLGAKPDAIESILAHNADGIADAKALNPKAAEVLAQLDDSGEEVAPPAPSGIQLVHPPADGSRETWRAWIGVFRDRLAEQSHTTYGAFADAHQEIIGGARTSERLLAIKALKDHAEKLGVPEPTWLASQVKAPADAKAPETSGATSTVQTAAAQPEEGVPATEADNRAIDGVISGLQTLTTIARVQAHTQETIPKTLHARLAREGKVGAVKRMEQGFDARIAALKPQA